jgi:hypothetical protein
VLECVAIYRTDVGSSRLTFVEYVKICDTAGFGF